MGKKVKNKKQGGETVKNSSKADKKALLKHTKMLERIGEANIAEVVAQLEANEKRRATVSETIVEYPSPRSNFSIVTHPEKEELIVFGGEFFNGQKLDVFNELLFYNIEKRQWKLVMAPGGPGPRSSHQMVAVANEGGQLWMFGGEHATPSQMQFYHYKDLWNYHIPKKTWSKVSVSGGPSPRSGHRMIALKKKLFVFGGFYDTGISYKYYNDVWCFSLDTYTWNEIKPAGFLVPAPRSAACMTATPDGKILIWGGYSKSVIKKDVDKGVTHTDMFTLVPESKDSNSLAWKWVPLKPGGIRPPPRSGVSIATASNGKVYSFGGVVDVNEDEETLQGNCSNDLNLLDLTNQKWKPIELNYKLKKTKNEPEDISSDVEVIGENSKNIAESIGETISQSMKKLTFPSPRMKCGMVVCKGHLYVYGGEVEQGKHQYTLNDMYSLDIRKLDEWKTIFKEDKNAHEWVESESDDDGSDDDSSISDDSSSDDTEMKY